ncbi:MAG: hypothetical protein WA958_07390 [Tunicatimonas sp.]
MKLYPYSHQVRANVGISGIGLVSGLVRRVSGVANIDVSVQPAYQLNYAYRWRDRVSFGAGVSRQVISARYRGYEYQDDSGATLFDNFTTYVRRLNVAGFVRWHYNLPETRLGSTQTGVHVQWYSGVRLGITHWTFDTNARDINYTVGRFLSFALGTQFAPQLILIGGDTYFSPHWGANFELGIGAPHLFSAGVAYRW